MSFVENDIVEVVFIESSLANQDRFVSSDTDIKKTWLHLVPDNVISNIRCWHQIHYSEERRPDLKLLHPVRDCRLGCYDEMWRFDLAALFHVGQDGDRFYCLAHSLKR